MMNHYQNQVCNTVVSLLTALFLYSCNASLGHHNMMEEVHSNPDWLSKLDNTTLTREEAIKAIKECRTFKKQISGGSAVVYDLDDGSVLRTQGSASVTLARREHTALSALRAIKDSNKALPIVDIYAIFKIDTGRSYFQPGYLFTSSAKPVDTSHYKITKDTCANVLAMQKVEMYKDSQEQDFNREGIPFDFELANVFLQYHGIEISDQPKTKNLGYILQNQPVQYTFKINDTLKTYQVVGQRAAEGTNQLYKKTIMIDYEGWTADHPVDHSAIQTKLDALVQRREIVRLS